MNHFSNDAQLFPPPPINDPIERLVRSLAAIERDLDVMNRIANSPLHPDTATLDRHIPPLAQTLVRELNLLSGCPHLTPNVASTDQLLSPGAIVEGRLRDPDFDLDPLPPPLGQLYSVCPRDFQWVIER